MTVFDKLAQWKLLPAVVSLTSAGTPQRVSATALWVLGWDITAESANTGVLRVGDSSATATYGKPLNPEETFTVMAPVDANGRAQVVNLYDAWIDGTVTADKAVVSYITAEQD